MDKIPYALTIGSIMYVMFCTKPLVAYALNITNRYLTNLDNYEDNFKVLKKNYGCFFLVYGGAKLKFCNACFQSG